MLKDLEIVTNELLLCKSVACEIKWGVKFRFCSIVLQFHFYLVFYPVFVTFCL